MFSILLAVVVALVLIGVGYAFEKLDIPHPMKGKYLGRDLRLKPIPGYRDPKLSSPFKFKRQTKDGNSGQPKKP